MGGVAPTSAKAPAPLKWKLRGNLAAILGEADGTSVSFRVTIDGKPPDGVLSPRAEQNLDVGPPTL